MLKKVVLTNVNTSKVIEVLVDTDDDAKAIMGAGKAPNETAIVNDIAGVDEFLQRHTGKKPSLDEMVDFFSGFARCLDRNISTVKSLELMGGRLTSPRYRGAVADIAQHVMGGDKLSDCFAMHPDLFGEDIVSLIRAGEESGQISQVLLQIAHTKKKSLKVLKKLKSGLIYPAIVLVISVVVVVMMSFTLIPAISKLYGSMNVQLPLATRVMMGFSSLLINQPYLALIPFGGVYAILRYWSKVYHIPSVQRAVTRMPTIGNIVRKSAAMVSFRCLAMLLQSNVRIVSALEIAAKASNHIDFEDFFLNVRNHINDGLSLSESFLMESHLLGPDGRTISAVVQMAGETGGVNEMLDEIATDYEDDLDAIAAQIDKILEPIVIVVMGSIVGFLVYAIYGPIFNLSKVILPKKPGAGQTAPARPPTR